MKKKMIMAAMFVGALSLGACVENNESASVEVVRGAKAEQLKSVATLNNANAEAALILAKADVAIKEAQAEALKIANELDGIELEVAKAGLTARLEFEKTEAEAQLLSAKGRLEQAKADLIAAMDKVTIAEKERVQTLLKEADDVLGRINGNRTLLITAKFNKAGLEAGLVGVKAIQEQNAVAQKRIIAKSEALIAEYKQYSQTSKDEALVAANEADAKAKGLNEVFTTANNAQISASTKLNTARNNVRQSAYLANATYRKFENVDGYTTEFTHSDGTYGSIYVNSYTKYMADTELMNADITRCTRELTILKSQLKDAEKALTDKKTSESYKALEKAVTDATKAYNEAATTADKQTTKAELEQAESNLKYAAYAEEQSVKAVTENVKDKEAELKTATEKLAAVSGDNATAYAALVKVWEDAMSAYNDAQIEVSKAFHNYSVQSQLAASLRSIASGAVDYAKLIQDETKTIADANATIAADKNVATKEEAIAKEDRTIAKLEQALKIDEAAYADYMAQIKALIDAAK